MNTWDILSPEKIVPGSLVHVSVFDFLRFAASRKETFAIRPLLADFRASYEQVGEPCMPFQVRVAASAHEELDAARRREITRFVLSVCEECGGDVSQTMRLTKKGNPWGTRFTCASGHRWIREG